MRWTGTDARSRGVCATSRPPLDSMFDELWLAPVALPITGAQLSNDGRGGPPERFIPLARGVGRRGCHRRRRALGAAAFAPRRDDLRLRVRPRRRGGPRAGMALISAALVVGLLAGTAPRRHCPALRIAWFAPVAVAAATEPGLTIGCRSAVLPAADRVSRRAGSPRSASRGASPLHSPSQEPSLASSARAGTVPRPPSSTPPACRLLLERRAARAREPVRRALDVLWRARLYLSAGTVARAIRRAVTATNPPPYPIPPASPRSQLGSHRAAELSRVITLVGAPVEDPIDPVLSALFVTLPLPSRS